MCEAHPHGLEGHEVVGDEEGLDEREEDALGQTPPLLELGRLLALPERIEQLIWRVSYVRLRHRARAHTHTHTPHFFTTEHVPTPAHTAHTAHAHTGRGFLFALLEVGLASVELLAEEIESRGQRFGDVGLQRGDRRPVAVLGVAVGTPVDRTFERTRGERSFHACAVCAIVCGALRCVCAVVLYR